MGTTSNAARVEIYVELLGSICEPISHRNHPGSYRFFSGNGFCHEYRLTIFSESHILQGSGRASEAGFIKQQTPNCHHLQAIEYMIADTLGPV